MDLSTFQCSHGIGRTEPFLQPALSLASTSLTPGCVRKRPRFIALALCVLSRVCLGKGACFATGFSIKNDNAFPIFGRVLPCVFRCQAVTHASKRLYDFGATEQDFHNAIKSYDDLITTGVQKSAFWRQF